MEKTFSCARVRTSSLMLLTLPLLLCGCRFVGWGYTNTSRASLANNVQGSGSGLATAGLNLRIHIAIGRQQAMQARLSQARSSARAMRQRAADVAQAAAEQTRQAIQEEAAAQADGAEDGAGSEAPNKSCKYPS